MKKRLLSAITLALVLSACGGGGGVVQDEVADLFIKANSDEGVELDADCVKEATASLSDDDAQAIVDAGVDGDPEVSPEVDAIGEALFGCIDAASYVDLAVNAIAEDDDTVDADCIREALNGLTVDEIDDKIFDAAFACTTE